jgi:hypothetical protein
MNKPMATRTRLREYMKRHVIISTDERNDLVNDKPHVSIRGLMLPLCIAGLVNLAILIAWCNA